MATDTGLRRSSMATAERTSQAVPREGIRIENSFCPADITDPFDTVEWDNDRTAVIKDENGDLLFEQTDCEIPKSWSQLATNVVVSKYFYGEIGTSERETSVRQLIHRVTRTISDWGYEDGYFASKTDAENFYRDLTWLCVNQHGAFNSPVWFNVGLFHQYGVTSDKCNWRWDKDVQDVVVTENPYEYPQGSACFIQSVDDNMDDIMRLATSEAMLFKFGSGTGTDLSTIRSHREKLSGGGNPSGPLSFMRVYDQIAAVVKSGGKTRRAAKMQSLKVWHPDILEFIECKHKEEQKAHVLIQKGGYEANFNGEAYSSILFQNANLSVRVTDEFMEAVAKDQAWSTRWVTNPKQTGPEYKARDLLSRMAECAWHCGDPGVQYDTTINRWHTCPNSGRINASNPCSEYMFLDNTACNLASINLMKFRCDNGEFDTDRFAAACRIFFIAQEILVDHASYPTDLIAKNSHLFRPLGLGYSNLGSLIMSSGFGYDSDSARSLCGSITAILHGAANRTSAELARAVGTFDTYDENKDSFLRVMEMHRDAVEAIDDSGPTYLKEAARGVWNDVLRHGRRSGFRNAQATVLAPTGTISFMMDCDTTGIEPDIALVKYKQLAGGGMMKIVNQTVPLALQTLGYSEAEIEAIGKHIDATDTIEGADELKDEHVSIFDCAFKAQNGARSINWRAHVSMMAAAQPFLSGAISKTVNMPAETTPAEIAEAYDLGWRMGLKALAIYRDGSKFSQPLNTSTDGEKTAEGVGKPRRERLPDTRRSVTHKFNVTGHEGYITVGLYDDGRPGEVFITMAKEGSTVGGLMDCFGTAISMSLQYGVPLEVLVNKFSHTRFEPMGFTKNPDIRIAKSVVDYIFRWMGIEFLPGYRESQNGTKATQSTSTESTSTGSTKAATAKDASQPTPETGHAAAEVTSDAIVSGSIASPPVANSGEANVASTSNENSQISGEFAKFQTDAPSCDNCGAITVRNGNCYLCHNCGNSMGCS